MESIERIVTPVSESWPIWVLLSLFVSLIIANQRQNGLIRNAWRGLVSASERVYNDTFDLIQIILINYFRVATPSLALYALLFQEQGRGPVAWLEIMALWLVMDAIKWGGAYLVRYTFGLEKEYPSALRYYSEVWMIANIILLPQIMYLLHWGGNLWIQISLALTIVLAWVLMLIKSFRLYLRKPTSVVYILIYFVTLEIIPMISIYGIIWKILRY